MTTKGMSVEDKQAVRKILIMFWELVHTEDKTESLSLIDEIIDSVEKLAEE